MLELSELALWLEDKINTALDTYTTVNNDTLLKSDRVKYKFKIDTDIGEHKGFDYLDLQGNTSIERTNRIVRYIQAQLTQNNSSVDSTAFIDVTRNTTLEILVPLNDIEAIENKNGVVEEIRNLLDSTFSLNGFGETADGDTFSYEFGLATTGARNLRTLVGDSVTLIAFINFYYVESGLNSSDVEIKIDNNVITPIRFGMSRGATQQTNTFSDDTRMVAMNTTTSSLFSINFDVVARKGTPLYATMYRHLLTGKSGAYVSGLEQQKANVAHAVEISIKNTDISTIKLMSFESVSMSGQNPLIASLSVTMVETKYVEGLTNISTTVSLGSVLDAILEEQK